MPDVIESAVIKSGPANLCSLESWAGGGCDKVTGELQLLRSSLCKSYLLSTCLIYSIQLLFFKATGIIAAFLRREVRD